MFTHDARPSRRAWRPAWSQAEYCSDLIVALAQKHGLCVYDPQNEAVLYPEGMQGDSNAVAAPWWKFWR